MLETLSQRRFRGSSGSYNVHALEIAAARDRHKLKGFSLTVKFLDNTERVFHVEKKAKGSALLDQVYHHLELVEKDYFGLQFSIEGHSPTAGKPELMTWLDPSKLIKKQLNNHIVPLYFRVKFYVCDPSKLVEEYTRYQFCLQIRRDILEKKLLLPESTATVLASYTAQAELGDYNPEENGKNYLSELQLVANQCEDIERKITELHKLHSGQLPAEAEFNFLDHAKKVDMYGVELHKAKDNANKDIELGVSQIGLVVFQKDIKINTFSWSKILKISFKHKQFFIQLKREQSENYDTLLGFNLESYRSCKTLWKSCVEHHTFFRLHSPKLKKRFRFLSGSRFSYSGRTEFQSLSEVRSRGRTEKNFVRSPSKQLIAVAPLVAEKGKVAVAPGRPPRPYDNKVTSLGAREPKKAWQADSHVSDDDGGFMEKPQEGPFSPGRVDVLSYADEECSTSNGLLETPPYSTSHTPTLPDDTVTIVMFPEHGKYGFNVRATPDEIIVSKVAPNTPADCCVPRLNEGDHVLQINNLSVSRMPQKDVVSLIEKARATNGGKLTMAVRPNISTGNHNGSALNHAEPPFQYVPEAGGVQVAPPSPGNALDQSMLLLADGLASGALIERYDSVYRKHPDLQMDVAMAEANINKNRYRDILPYDSTRVELENGECGDYINANYVNMRINGTDLVNKYIATQGPLTSTTDDFWQMILEQKCYLIVMVTALIEAGRVKCHKYWPDLEETLVLNHMTVKCTEETVSGVSDSFIFRTFLLVDHETNDERIVRHMQYLAWPDHGVPDSPGFFLDFIDIVRQSRTDMDTPIVVHCSAGIGRTGVLVLMETALCLIDAEEPVYPLEIVKTMREQRAMMLQNAIQYRFVCDSVFAAYTRKLTRQLTEQP